MFIDYRKLFAHLLSNFDLDLYKSILFIVISKIIKYTFFEIRFLEFFVFPFSRNIVSWNIYFFKKKKKRKKFLSSNMATQCFQYRFVNISKRRAKKQRIRPIIITSFSIFEIAPLEIWKFGLEDLRILTSAEARLSAGIVESHTAPRLSPYFQLAP